jgi:hypothetical protein
MIVYLWDACGLDRRARGVTDAGKAHALQLAEEALRSAGVAEVLVEEACAVLGIRTLEHGYQRTGVVWRGRITHVGGRVAWNRLTTVGAASALPAASAGGAP